MVLDNAEGVVESEAALAQLQQLVKAVGSLPFLEFACASLSVPFSFEVMLQNSTETVK